VDSIQNNVISNLQDLQSLYAKVYKMREELLKSVFLSETQVKLIELPISLGAKKDLTELIAEQNKILDRLSVITDFELAAVQLDVAKFAANLQIMSSKYSGIIMEPQFFEMWQGMKSRMESVLSKSKMPPEMRTRFIGNVIIE